MSDNGQPIAFRNAHDMPVDQFIQMLKNDFGCLLGWDVSGLRVRPGDPRWIDLCVDVYGQIDETCGEPPSNVILGTVKVGLRTPIDDGPVSIVSAWDGDDPDDGIFANIEKRMTYAEAAEEVGKCIVGIRLRAKV